MGFEEFRDKVSANIRKARADRGLTQEDVADLEMSARGFQKIEAGETDVRLSSLYIIAKKLGVHPSELLRAPIPWKK